MQIKMEATNSHAITPTYAITHKHTHTHRDTHRDTLTHTLRNFEMICIFVL